MVAVLGVFDVRRLFLLIRTACLRTPSWRPDDDIIAALMNTSEISQRANRGLLRLALRPDDLLLDRTYRRLWSSILISSFGAQVTLLALPLTAAVLLQASPTQMGVLTAMEIVPFALLSLPTGVWLDRVRKLPVYVLGELMIAAEIGRASGRERGKSW